MTASKPQDVTVLLVEDNPDHRAQTERAVTEAGFRVISVRTGEEALSRLEEVDLVLLDFSLPGMSGLEMLKATKNDGYGPSVVMVTGMGSEAIAAESLRAGAIDYVVKQHGYLRELPAILDRAWRLHDMSQRATELQRLALTIGSVSDRSEVMHEIATGAQRLLRARACSLWIAQDGDFVCTSRAGASTVEPVLHQSQRQAFETGEPKLVGSAESVELVVPIFTFGGQPLAVLQASWDPAVEVAKPEVDIARAFAGFAAIAIRNLDRLEMERALVAELKKTVELKNDIIGTVSHELRTPLTCIRGFSQTLLQRGADLTNDEKNDLLQRIVRHSLDLERLSGGLNDLSVSTYQSLAAPAQHIDLRAMIERIMLDLEPATMGSAIEVKVEPIEVDVDPVLVGRVMNNLVSNAIKYSAPERPIQIRSSIGEGSVRISVIDRGLGISPEDAEHVFKPFWRGGDLHTRTTRGAGIGLALVSKYVEAIGGEVGVESVYGTGSTFFFTIPLSSSRTNLLGTG